MASEDPAIDSGLKAVSLLKSHSLFARNTAPAVGFEGSILLCNRAPARSENWGVVDVQVDSTGLAIIRPHRSSPDKVRQCTPKVSGALTSLDPRWGRSIMNQAVSVVQERTKCKRCAVPSNQEL